MGARSEVTESRPPRRTPTRMNSDPTDRDGSGCRRIDAEWPAVLDRRETRRARSASSDLANSSIRLGFTLDLLTSRPDHYIVVALTNQHDLI
jgi:hypothetical protein